MMFETNLPLIVPADRQVRDEIRKEVGLFLRQQKMFPPVSYNSLNELAGTLLKRYGWDRGYRAFVMVCCGNEVWRDIVDAIPYSRRMLLLPQCLKNSHFCKARQDELGLLCSECGNCSISGFLSEAESLGYLTIVSEGTTIATRLVESGRVDAVIGVGCMEVLKKMFHAVNKYSVPSIGVPLLTCGCVDTIADAEWIKEEIRHMNHHSGFRMLNLNRLKEKTDGFFREGLIKELLNLAGSPTDDLVLETMLAGGKRMRPLLTVLAYEAFSQQPDSFNLQHLALSVECFHKASLIHDDIEDNDTSRYGKETLHARYGVPVAMNIGDLLIGEGYRLISECRMSPHLIKECLRVVSQGHKALATGQGVELMARKGNTIPTLKEMLAIYANKTSAAFKVSLLLGALAGGAEKRMLTVLDCFSHLIGRAYQLKDDLEDFRPATEVSSFNTPSALIALLHEKADDTDRSLVRGSLLDRHTSNLMSLMEKYRIREQITTILREQIEEIDSCLLNLDNIGLKLALHEIVGKTFRDYI